MSGPRHRLLKYIGPGILVAATGVGAGDLATATFTGAHLGTAVLWAVLVGAFLKFVLNEGLTRWQLATGTTLLEGAVDHLGRPMRYLFLAYFLAWSYFVAMALMSACGAAAQAIAPFWDDPSQGKVGFGIVHSFIAVALVMLGGYRLFEQVMRVCIGLMFFTVCLTAVALSPDWGDVVVGLVTPRIPRFADGGLEWTIALLGGVGGTVTVLCYGYWIREEKRESVESLRLCRVDLLIGYSMTALFGLAMVIIGSRIGKLDTKGVTLIIEVAQTLEGRLGSAGPLAKWAFLAGAWGAVFSSLLGVWQSVPYLFADFWYLTRGEKAMAADISSRSNVYRVYLALIAILPITGLVFFNFSTAMKVNGMIGAVFIPMLTVALLILNGRADLVGERHKNSVATTGLLAVTLVVSAIAGSWQIMNSFK